MPASQHDLDMALANYVIFRPMSVVTELVGNRGRVAGLKGVETDWKVPGDTSPANLVTVPGTEFNLQIDAFVTALGYRAEPVTQATCPDVKFSKKGLVQTSKDGISTSHPQVFAGGDIVRGPALVVDAVADGKAAGQKIIKLLQQGKTTQTKGKRGTKS